MINMLNPFCKKTPSQAANKQYTSCGEDVIVRARIASDRIIETGQLPESPYALNNMRIERESMPLPAQPERLQGVIDSVKQSPMTRERAGTGLHSKTRRHVESDSIR